MVGSFHSDDVSAEVGAQQKTQGLDHVLLLGLATRQAQLRELLIRTQHHQLRPKHHTGNKMGKKHTLKGPLGLVIRQAQLCELLVWTQHHQLRPKHHAREKTTTKNPHTY